LAWTTPLTWVASQLVTAAQLNTHLRDNMNETAVAKVTTAGDTVYATGPNALARRAIGGTGTVYQVSGGVPTWQGIGGTPSSVGTANANGASNVLANVDHVHAYEAASVRFQNAGDNGKKVQIGKSTTSSSSVQVYFNQSNGPSISTTTFGVTPMVQATSGLQGAGCGVQILPVSTTGFSTNLYTWGGSGSATYDFYWEAIG
jgi:hypothetical protein